MSKLNPEDLDKVLTDAEQRVVESKINEVLHKNGIDRDEVGKISRVSVSTYQTVTKGEDGEPVINDLEAVKVVLHPSWEAGPQWEIIRHFMMTKPLMLLYKLWRLFKRSMALM